MLQKDRAPGRGYPRPVPTRVRTAESRLEFERTIEDHVMDRWRVVHLGPYKAVLKRRTWGRWPKHLLVFVLLGWWTFGLANLAYGLIARARAEVLDVRLVVSDAGYRPDGRPAPSWLPAQRVSTFR